MYSTLYAQPLREVTCHPLRGPVTSALEELHIVPLGKLPAAPLEGLCMAPSILLGGAVCSALTLAAQSSLRGLHAEPLEELQASHTDP